LTPPPPPALPLYLYFDEAGDLDFGRSGTSFFLCGILATYDPWPLMRELPQLRERLFRGQFIPQAFHAAEDKQAVRDAVFSLICELGGFDMHVFVFEKAEVPPSHRDQATFYTFAADFALRMVLEWHPTDEPIYVITDTLPLRGKREAVVKGFKASLAALLRGRLFQIEHHSSGSQACLQAADYLTWAVFKKWERRDTRSYEQVRDFLAQEVTFDWTLIRQKE
jgi:hypothetical protein